MIVWNEPFVCNPQILNWNVNFKQATKGVVSAGHHPNSICKDVKEWQASLEKCKQDRKRREEERCLKEFKAMKIKEQQQKAKEEQKREEQRKKEQQAKQGNVSTLSHLTFKSKTCRREAKTR
jgi:chromatin segregation and condensation protein Rec8/ScpA/Scc1 (kleisin family)